MGYGNTEGDQYNFLIDCGYSHSEVLSLTMLQVMLIIQRRNEKVYYDELVENLHKAESQ